METFMAADQ
jgi:hypothetical protein